MSCLSEFYALFLHFFFLNFDYIIIFYFYIILNLEGEEVEFEIIMDKRGPGSRTAMNVTGPDGVRPIGVQRPAKKDFEPRH